MEIRPVESLALNWKRLLITLRDFLSMPRSSKDMLRSVKFFLLKWLRLVGLCLIALIVGVLLSLAVALLSGNFNNPPGWAVKIIVILLALPTFGLFSLTMLPFCMVLVSPIIFAFISPIIANLLLRGPAIEPEKRRFVNQGTWNSLLGAIAIGLASAFLADVAVALGDVIFRVRIDAKVYFVWAVMIGSIGALSVGIAVIEHYLLRLFLYFSGSAPFRITHFLEAAVERVFMEKVWGAYRFIHPLLEEQFAVGKPAA